MHEPQPNNQIAEELAKFYKREVVNKVMEYYPEISAIQMSWDKFLTDLAEWFTINPTSDENLLRALEKASLSKFTDRVSVAENGLVLGFDGPGGTGKGTVVDQIGKAIKVTRAINATSREKREYEQEGVHYFFKEKEQVFTGCTLSENAIRKLQQVLNLKDLPSSQIDTVLATMIEEYCDRQGVMISLELDATDTSDKLTVAYKPNRGWYNILKSSVESSVKDGAIGVVEESGDSWRNLAISLRNLSNPPLLAYVIILPPQPIAFTLAARALNRDGVDQSKEQLLSTIGARHIDQTRILLTTAQELDIPLVVLVNDDMEMIDDQIVTRAGSSLIKVLSTS